jgi:hypothetical protein
MAYSLPIIKRSLCVRKSPEVVINVDHLGEYPEFFEINDLSSPIHIRRGMNLDSRTSLRSQ